MLMIDALEKLRALNRGLVGRGSTLKSTSNASYAQT